jgi:hypothetical protein
MPANLGTTAHFSVSSANGLLSFDLPPDFHIGLWRKVE